MTNHSSAPEPRVFTPSYSCLPENDWTNTQTRTHEVTVAVIAAESKTHCMWAVQNLKPAAIGHVCSRKEENQNRNRKQSSKPRQLLDLTWIYHAPAVPVVQTKLRRKLHWVSVTYLWNQWTQLHLLKFLRRNKYLGGACRPAKNRVFVANLPLPRWIIFAHIQTVPGVYPQSSADQLAFLQSAAELPMIGRDFLHIFKISWLYTSGSGLQRKFLMQPRFQRQLFFANLKPFEEISDISVEYIHIILIYIISIRIHIFLLVAWVASIQGPHERGPVELDNHIVRVLDLWGAAAGWVAFCGSYPQKAQGLHRSMAGNTTARWRHVSEAGFVLNWRKISSTR